MALRIYADTSVIGGCVDIEFSEDSRRLLIKAYNEVNREMGYGALMILSPKEVVYGHANENQEDV